MNILTTIKIIHTIIWLFFNIVLAYMFYEAITDQITNGFWIGLGLIIAECLILVVNRWQCPLTIVARKYSDSKKENFDIYLPEWLARNNKQIYSILFVMLMSIYLYQTL